MLNCFLMIQKNSLDNENDDKEEKKLIFKLSNIPDDSGCHNSIPKKCENATLIETWIKICMSIISFFESEMTLEFDHIEKFQIITITTIVLTKKIIDNNRVLQVVNGSRT